MAGRYRKEFRDDSVQFNRMRRSINRIIGSANNASPMDVESLATVFRQRFNARPALDPSVAHSLFPEFIWSKAEELIARRQSTK